MDSKSSEEVMDVQLAPFDRREGTDNYGILAPLNGYNEKYN